VVGEAAVEARAAVVEQRAAVVAEQVPKREAAAEWRNHTPLER